jgi:hypothetical protein
MKYITFLLTLILTLSLLTGCLPVTPTLTPVSGEIVSTLVALTVEAITVKTLEAVPPTSTPLPSTPTFPPPTATAQPSPTPAASPAKGYILCDSAEFLGDVSIPDNDIIPAGSTFKKMWAVKNSGVCTWDSTYSIVFTSGDLIGASNKTALAGPVPPGGTALLTVVFKIPADKLDQPYTSFWKLSDPAGNTFGTGAKNLPFSVIIKSGEIYNFLLNPCSGSWQNTADVLYCPSKKGDSKGYYYVAEKPKLENGLTGTSPALVMAPQAIANGQISVRYAPVMVLSDFLHTDIGCMFDNKACDAQVGISYSVDGGDQKSIDEWHEVYDGQTTPIEINLRDLNLSGKNVSFTFTVKSNSSGAEQSEIFWTNPRLGP